MGVGHCIGKLALSRGISLKELSRQANIPYTTLYSAVSRDNNSMSLENLYKIASGLGVSLDFLLGDIKTFDTAAEFETAMNTAKAATGTDEIGIAHKANGMTCLIKPGTDSSDPVNYAARLQASFDVLNTEGQKRAVEQVEELTEISRYRK